MCELAHDDFHLEADTVEDSPVDEVGVCAVPETDEGETGQGCHHLPQEATPRTTQWDVDTSAIGEGISN